MISREMLKTKVDHLDDEHLELLDEILNFLAMARDRNTPMKETECRPEGAEWRAFLEKFAGCMKDAPMKRQPQSDVGPHTDLAEFLRESPLSGVELDLEREKD
jgi:hypothetical protein